MVCQNDSHFSHDIQNKKRISFILNSLKKRKKNIQGCRAICEAETPVNYSEVEITGFFNTTGSNIDQSKCDY